MSKAPTWFIVVAVIALLWNILGCVAFISDLQLKPEDIAKLPESQQALYATRPAWSVAATGLAVFGGVLGCIGLIIRHKWAFVVLAISLLGIIAQDVAMFLMADTIAIAGSAVVVLQTIVLLVGIGLVLLSRKGISRGWLS